MLMRTLFLIAMLWGISGCPETETVTQEDARETIPLLLGFEQGLIVPTSVLSFELRGTERLVGEVAEVSFEGADGNGTPINITQFIARTDRIGDQGNILVRVPVSDQLWPALSPAPNSVFHGRITVELIDEIGVLGRGTLEGQRIEARSELPPTIDAITTNAVFPGEKIRVSGQDFLMPDEGKTTATVNGTIRYSDDTTRTIENREVVFVWDGQRTEAGFPLDPAVFGVQVMTFEGSLVFENVLSNGQRFAGGQQDSFGFEMQPPLLATFSPEAGSRGQKIALNGRGLVANSSSSTTDEYYGMILRFDGVLRFDEGGEVDLSGESALERAPDRVISDSEAELAVWYEITDGKLTGLGAKPGVFTGRVIPIAFDQWGEQVGEGFEGEFRILPTTQVVHIKYLPAFSKGLEKYGIQNLEYEIRRRIMDVVTRDYAQVRVQFREQVPTDFIDFATIEIGGPDPSGEKKFGYDNTCNDTLRRCKDTDNLFLADYLGGVNRNSSDEFNTPYGGVFIESFDYFSKTLNPTAPDSSEDFDRVLKPFMGSLGGEAVRGTEWPDGPRSAQIADAIHMVGSVIGNTISHEIGHSLGLSFYETDRIKPGEAFHNRIPCPNCMMDAGSDRPFEERAELNGVGPAAFNQRNLDYLLQILSNQ